MQQWIVHAWDSTESSALEHRLEVRPRHLAGARKLKENGNFVLGGAMLDDSGMMIGSTMIVQFETIDELNHWISIEPYIQEGIWQRWQIFPFRVADV